MEKNLLVDSFIINGIEIPKFDKNKIQYYTTEQIKACGGFAEFAQLIGYEGSGKIEIDISEAEYQAMLNQLKTNK
ncbi:MAG: hypothetical protein MUE85_00385 [Microscillaceae bacterium]|jgi:hypothetical protein|nr:hypothetical protein [Microscillaceae bacterium]